LENHKKIFKCKVFWMQHKFFFFRHISSIQQLKSLIYSLPGVANKTMTVIFQKIQKKNFQNFWLPKKCGNFFWNLKNRYFENNFLISFLCKFILSALFNYSTYYPFSLNKSNKIHCRQNERLIFFFYIIFYNQKF
jgi:hypothetical protein